MSPSLTAALFFIAVLVAWELSFRLLLPRWVLPNRSEYEENKTVGPTFKVGGFQKWLIVNGILGATWALAFDQISRLAPSFAASIHLLFDIAWLTWLMSRLWRPMKQPNRDIAFGPIFGMMIGFLTLLIAE